jgi:hypothetical protein
MARYYFDLHNGDGPTTDVEGIELPSRKSVTLHISRILTDIARDEMPTEDRAVISVKVRDDQGRVISVASLTFNSEWLD